MIEMPPLQFAQTNGIRMGYYEAGPKTDAPPVILCHGWPEIAFSWRHQIKALSEAGIRVIAPDQRGYGATDRPEPVEAYDIEHLTGDLVGLLDHLKIDKAIFVGHDWGGFIVWQMPLRHIDRVAGVVGINTPHTNRAPADPIELVAQAFRRAHVYRPVPGPRARARPDLRQPGRADFRCLHAQAGAARQRAGRRGGRRRRRIAAAQPGISANDRRPTTPSTTRGRRSCRRKRKKCSSTPSRSPASPAASTGTATCRATGSARPTSTIPCGCRR